MRASRWTLSVLVVGLAVAVVGHAQPPLPAAQAAFYGIGNPVFSLVRDATKVGSTIHAVGTVKNTGTGANDAALWTLDGTNPPVQTSLPNFVLGGAQVNAEAITRDGAYIASQGRDNGGPSASRVTVSGLGSINLNAAPYTVFNRPTSARTISDNGLILYGNVGASVNVILSGSTTGLRNRPRAARFEVSTGTSSLIDPIAAPQDNQTNPIQQQLLQRGASSDGSVAVGWNFRIDGATGFPVSPADDQAFRYTNIGGSTSVADIPRLTGGTWNRPVAISGDGNLVTMFGDTGLFPNGEIYVYNATTGAKTELGSPNTPWGMPVNLGGMTEDGSVVAAAFADPAVGLGSSGYAYFHNAHGWFQLTSALAAAGINLSGWQHLFVYGMSSDGSLVWGWGLHNGIQEGFVAEFATADYLKNFDVVAAGPTDTSIVGVWAADDSGNPDATNPIGVVAFMADGTYYVIEPDGMERGAYTFDGSSVSATTRLDMNGDSGLSDDNGRLLPVSIVGDELHSPANCTFDSNNPDVCFIARRVTAGPGEPYGGWVLGNPMQDDSSVVFVLTASGKYFLAQDGNPAADPGGRDGIEIGTLQWNAATGDIAVNFPLAVDTNGQWGLSDSTGAVTARLSADELQLIAGDSTGLNAFIRIVNPATVVPAITSALTASGTATTPFSYTITASHGLTFGAPGAPAWLSVDSATGLLSGTPPAAGTFNVAISATNTFGDTGSATLGVTVAPPNTSTGSDVTIDPIVPSGSPTVGLTFTSVTGSGETTVTVIDPTTDPAAEPPPSGFTLGDSPVYYEIETTASFTGPVEVCFNYTGVNLGTGTPRLFHFVGGVWTDITTSVDTVNSVICGTTTSFSPFAIFVSPVTRTGFYSPVTSTPGFVNVVKGGSNVPLRFNVYVDGVEKTDTAGLDFGLWAASCSDSTTGNAVPFTTTGGTALRYDAIARTFIQNWKTPATPGCYVVRMTTAADGLSLSALVRVK